MYSSQSNTYGNPIASSSSGGGMHDPNSRPGLGSGIRTSVSTSNIGNWPHSNVDPSSSSGAGGAGSGGFGQSQYEPGYLLSSTMSSGGPSYPAPPLIPDPISGKRPTSMHTTFGSEPFASTFRAASIPPRGMSVVPNDDENAPPSNSILEGINTPDTKRNFRASMAGGFFPDSPSPAVHSRTNSALASSTPLGASTSANPNSTVIVFGFPHALQSEVLRMFALLGDIANYDAPVNKNWMTITFNSSWEAAKAIRKNGDIISLGSDEIMIGVKWANDNGAANADTDMLSSPTKEPAPRLLPSSSSTIGRPVSLAPSRSAFKSRESMSLGGGGAFSLGRASGNDWGAQLRSEGEKDAAGGAGAGAPSAGGPPQAGVWGKVSDLIFGW